MSDIKDMDYFIKKLMDLPRQFEELYFDKKYPQAKYKYDTAMRVVSFLEVDKQIIEDLFGYRSDSSDDEEYAKEGLFDRKLVSDCYLKCILQDQTRENELYRLPWEAVRYLEK